MQHTIVIEIPAGADPNEVERWATYRLQAEPYSTDGRGGRAHLRVIEYHHEKMTEDWDSLGADFGSEDVRPKPPGGREA